MKQKILLLLLLLGVALPSMGQGRYRIYQCSGEVTWQQFRKTEWLPLEKRQSVALPDLLRIPQGAAVTILDSSTRALYRSTSGGEMRVKQLIDEALAQSAALCRSVNAEIRSQFEAEHRSQKAYAMAGVVYRGTQTDGYEEALYASVVSAVEQVRSGNFAVSDASWRLTRKEAEEQIFCFEIANATAEPRYVNVLRVTADTATFCFRFADAEAEQCVLVAPNERRVVSQFRFVAEGDDARYLLVVTDAPYAPQAIEMRLKNRMQPQAEPADGVCVVEEYR